MQNHLLVITALLIGAIAHGNANTLIRSPEYSRESKISDTNSAKSKEETTTIPEPIISTCGGVIEGASGIIEYALDVNYGPNLRCIWTIRTSPPTTQIRLIKEFSSSELGFDYLTAFSFVARQGFNSTAILGKNSHDEEEALMTGSVVLLQFTTDGSTNGNGFRLRFNAVGEAESRISHSYDFNTGRSPSTISYYSDTGTYENNQLSTFLLSPNYSSVAGSHRLAITVYSLENSSGCVYDGLLLYRIGWETIQQVALYCGNSDGVVIHSSDFALLLLMYTDESDGGSGFKAIWEKQ